MKTLKFILEKIVIIEVMLIILYIACQTFSIDIEILNLIINTGLTYLTPIAIFALIGYLILSLLTSKLIGTIISIIVAILIAYYLITYIL